MPYWTMDEKGHCYGYAKEQLQAPKTVMYASPTMALRMKTVFHTHIVYLQNNQSPQQHEMKLSSRSGTPRQAKAASKFTFHKKRKASQFDSVVSNDDDDYINAATVLNNSNFFGEAVNKYPWLKSADLISQTVSISKLNPIGAHRVPRKLGKTLAFTQTILTRIGGLSRIRIQRQGNC